MDKLTRFIEEKQGQRYVKVVRKILETRSYKDVFGNKLKSTEAQMRFLLNNFEIDTIQRMLKNKQAYIVFDDYYIEVFLVHSLTVDDMCIVFNNLECKGEYEYDQAAITIGSNGKLIDTYIGDVKYDYNEEDNTILI